MAAEVDLDRLLKLRVLVARFGERDLAGWWDTEQLGRDGAAALRRGFPRTHYFAQARSVFAVASQRCEQTFNLARTVTLWRLPEEIEEDFDTRWQAWLDHAEAWASFFESIQSPDQEDLVMLLCDHDVVGPADIAAYETLCRAQDVPAVALPAPFSGTDRDIALLGLGFALGTTDSLVVPYARRP